MTLAVDNLDVRYGGVHAVRGLSFDVAAAYLGESAIAEEAQHG